MDLKQFGNIFKQEGTSRPERKTPALDPRTVKIDDRRLEEFLIYARNYASQLRFESGPKEAEAESWEHFFSNDTAFLVAEIAVINTAEIKNAFDRLYARFQQEKKQNNFASLTKLVSAQFKRIDRWYSLYAESFLHDELSLYIRSYLREDYSRLAMITDYVRKIGNDNIEWTSEAMVNRDDVWNLKPSHEALLGSKLFAGADEEEKLENAAMMLTSVFESALNVTANCVKVCRNYFEDGIYKRQDHPPHIALFIAFIRLYGFAQDELNKLPGRLLDFYYKEVLQIHLKKEEPDRAVILPELTKGFDHFFLERNTRLSAGKDKTGKELFYKTQRDIIVNNAKVEAIKTLFLERDDKQRIVNYYANTLLPQSDDSAVYRRPFGLPLAKAKIHTGFAIASTQFYLGKGQRDISITFFIKAELKQEEFNKSLFNLLLTGEKGWLSCDSEDDGVEFQSFKKNPKNPNGYDSIEINFSISIGQPSAIVAFDPAIHEGNFSTVLPMMQLLLKYPEQPAKSDENAAYENSIQSLHELQAIEIVAASIKVVAGSLSAQPSFDGVRDLILENHETNLDGRKPFLPFTTNPIVGSSFYIGCNDLYFKSVQHFSINIDWMLPDDFDIYYQRYFPPYDNNQFMASLHMLIKKKWRKIKDVSLIDNRQQDNGRFRSIHVDKKEVDAAQEIDKNEKSSVSKFDTSRPDQTIKLKLLHPDFGHEIYPQLITSVVMDKATMGKNNTNYYDLLKRQLNDSMITIKLPTDEEIKDPNGLFQTVVYGNLKISITKENQARISMTEGLAFKILEFNQIATGVSSMAGEISDNKVIVNDDSFLARIISFLKKIKLLDSTVFYDRDKQDIGDVTDDLRDKLNKRVNRFIPSDRELSLLILGQVNSVISQVALKTVDELMVKKNTKMPDGDMVLAVLKQQTKEANEIINDLIAGKIAMVLAMSEIPPRPYTPLINSMAISYTSNKVMRSGIDQFFHILPFGTTEIFPLKPGPTTDKRLFPGQLGTTKDTATGFLFVGIRNLSGGQNLTLFFHFTESLRKNDKRPPDIAWWYLHDNKWIQLEEDCLLFDGTDTFQKSGIIEISVPTSITVDKSMFNQPGLSWISATINGNPGVFPDLTAIKAQAVSVEFEDDGNDPHHLALPLEPNKINRFVEVPEGIQRIQQPVASSDGRMRELEDEYFIRASERLRHKQRAVTSWDYERLVLEEFPFVYKVNAINNYNGSRFMAGHVTVVPIINLKNTATGDLSLEIPKASYPDLKKIEEYLAQHCSCFCNVHVVNPDINYIQVKGRIKFKKGKDNGYYLNKLNQELVKFLTPWGVKDAETLPFSGKVYLSSIINFIDKRQYVEYIKDVVMNQYTENEAGEKDFVKNDKGITNLAVTVLKTPHSIIASAPSHAIELI